MTRRVLVVEDEPIVAMCLEDILADLDCTVLGPAASAAEGLRLAETAPLDAAILDINLGDGTSYAVAELLRGRGVPIVFATGYDRHDAAAFPDALLLRKPYAAGQIAQVLDHVLAGPPDA